MVWRIPDFQGFVFKSQFSNNAASPKPIEIWFLFIQNTLKGC